MMIHGVNVPALAISVICPLIEPDFERFVMMAVEDRCVERRIARPIGGNDAVRSRRRFREERPARLPVRILLALLRKIEPALAVYECRFR